MVEHVVSRGGAAINATWRAAVTEQHGSGENIGKTGTCWPTGQGQGSKLLGSANMLVDTSFSRGSSKITHIERTAHHIKFTFDL